MSVFKRIAAGLTAVCMVAACTGCSDTRTAMTVGDYTVPAGVYLYYLNSAYNSALNQLAQENPDLDTTDEKAVKASYLEGKDVRTWIEDKATESCLEFVATEQKFDELGLSLDSDTKANIDSMMEYYLNYYGYDDILTEAGISEESFRKIMTSSYKSEEIFNYYYAVGGAEGVTEDELKTYYQENNIRAQYIYFSLHDTDGNVMESDEKAEVKAEAEAYQKRAEEAYQSGGLEALMLELDAIQDEILTAKEEQANAEAASAEEEAADDGIADDEIIEETAEALDAPRIVTLEELSSDEEEVPEEEAESSDEESGTPEEEEAESSDEESGTPEEEEAESSDEESGTPEEEAEPSNEESGTPEEEAEPSDEETDTLDEEADLSADEGPSYINEEIISVINKDDYENEEDIYYTPDEAVYNKLLEITEADYGTIYLVEEEEAIYLVTRYDITQRMTEDDLWSETAVSNVQYAKYYEDYEAKLDEWSAALTVTKNEASFKRYDPFEFHFG